MESPSSMYNSNSNNNQTASQTNNSNQNKDDNSSTTTTATTTTTNGTNNENNSITTGSNNNIVIPSNFLISTKEIIARFPHNKRVGHYLLGRKLGEGSFAKVKEGLHTLTGQKVAIKVIDKKKAKEDAYVSKNMRREGKLLQMIIHPNIIQLYELMETENSYYLVTELCEGGDLMDYICARKYLSEVCTRKFIRQIISAVDYLHRIGILHRDLKIENLLLDKNLNIKLIDFGLSNYTKSELCITQCGSPAYAAPELLAHKKYGSKVDVWSIGVNMYAMLTGNLPFTVEPFNIKALYNKMMKNEMNAIPDHLSKSGEDLLRKLLNPDPVKRISLKEAMEHAWINEGYATPLKPFPYPNKPTEDQVNPTILRYMNSNMEFSLTEVADNIKANKPSSSLATYYLLLNKVKTMIMKMDPKKDKVIKPRISTSTGGTTTTVAAAITTTTTTHHPPTTAGVAHNNNDLKPATIKDLKPIKQPSANSNQTAPAGTTAASGASPLPRTVKTTTAPPATNYSTTTTGGRATTTTTTAATVSPATTKFSARVPERSLSPATNAASRMAPSTTIAGAIKNLTHKYKTMHLSANGGGGEAPPPSSTSNNSTFYKTAYLSGGSNQHLSSSMEHGLNHHHLLHHGTNYHHQHHHRNHHHYTGGSSGGSGDTNNSESLSSDSKSGGISTTTTQQQQQRTTPTSTNKNAEWTQLIRLNPANMKTIKQQNSNSHDLNNNSSESANNNNNNKDQFSESSSIIHLMSHHQNNNQSGSTTLFNNTNATSRAGVSPSPSQQPQHASPTLAFPNPAANSRESADTTPRIAGGFLAQRMNKSPLLHKTTSSPMTLPAIDPHHHHHHHGVNN